MTVYVVSTTGSNANGTGSLASPWATFAYASNLIAAGDLLYVRGGTYDEAMLNRFPSGIDANHKTRIVGYPGDSVPVIAPSTATSANWALRVTTKSDQSYEGLKLDGLEVNIDTVKLTDTASRIDLIGCTVTNAPLQGVLMTGTGSGHLLRNCTIHGNGLTYADEVSQLHNVYCSVPDVTIEDCTIYGALDPGGYGIHAYGGDPSRLIVRRCKVYSNQYGIGIFTGSDMRVENCITWGNSAAGLRMAYGAASARAWHNTILDGFYNGGSPTSNCELVNNIIWPVRAHITDTGSVATALRSNLIVSITDAGSGTVTEGNVLDTDPVFVDQGGNDYRIRPTSPAAWKGRVVPEVTTDYLGKPRPTGALMPSIGAYEPTVAASGGRPFGRPGRPIPRARR